MLTLITELYLNEMKPNKNKFRVLRIKSSTSNLYNNMDISRFAHLSNTSIIKLTSGLNPENSEFILIRFHFIEI